MRSWGRLQIALVALASILALGTIGYVAFGFTVLDAVYQSVMTVTTVGFEEVEPFGAGEKIFTTVLMLAGVGTALYTLGVLLETLVEGQLIEFVGRRRMDRDIRGLSGHTIIAGWGRVGRTIARHSAADGADVVVIDKDTVRLADCEFPHVLGDATDDETLRAAGVERAKAVIAAVEDDASNLFIVISARALKPDLFIVARARSDTSQDKFLRGGADRVVNPQQIGGARMAAFVQQPNVAEFLDVVMHDGSFEFRLAEARITKASMLAGTTLRDAHIRDATGALVLAIKDDRGDFRANPRPDTELCAGEVIIAVGTEDQLDALQRLVSE
jgi:voltage-gated potassium channel